MECGWNERVIVTEWWSEKYMGSIDTDLRWLMVRLGKKKVVLVTLCRGYPQYLSKTAILEVFVFFGSFGQIMRIYLLYRITYV